MAIEMKDNVFAVLGGLPKSKPNRMRCFYCWMEEF